MWQHKKYGKKLFKSKYQYDSFKSKHCPTDPLERTFVLEHFDQKKEKLTRLTFESYQAAKLLGWTKV